MKVIDYDNWIENPKRKKSKEIDFGVHWKVKGSKTSYRLSWIEDTQELYAVELWGMAPGIKCIVLGKYPLEEVRNRINFDEAPITWELTDYFPELLNMEDRI